MVESQMKHKFPWLPVITRTIFQKKARISTTIAVDLLFSTIFIIFINAVFSTALYAFGLKTTFSSTLLLASLLYTYFLKFQKQNSFFQISSFSIILGYALISMSALFASIFEDFSWDGRQYQSEAVLQIHLGLNPVTEIILPNKWDVSWALWINSLSKVQWILREIPLDFGLSMNATNYLNFVALILLALAGVALGSSLNLNKFQSWLVGLVSASSIPVILQVSTGYADALPVTFLSIFCIVSVALIKGKVKNHFDKILILLAILLVSTKLSQIISFAVVVSLLAIASNKFRNVFFSIKSMAFISTSVALLSFNPLITNSLLFGNPFYPLKSSRIFPESSFSAPNLIGRENGSTFQDLVYSANIPAAFQSIPSFMANVLSPFLKTTNDVNSFDLSGLLKLPFVVQTSELMSLHNPDIRIGGLGPFFLTIFVFLILLVCLVDLKGAFFLIWSVVVIGLLLTPYGWWSRYTGFAWVIVPIVLALALSEINEKSLSKKKIAKSLIALVGLLSITQATFAMSLTLGKSIQNSNYFNQVSEAKSTPIELDSAFSGYRYNYVLSGQAYILSVVEVDYFVNMISPNLSESERSDYVSCYRYNEGFLEFHNGLGGSNSSSSLFNQNGIMTLYPESCDFVKLAALEKKRTLKGFGQVNIFNPR